MRSGGERTARVQRGERIVRQRFALLELPSIDVTYAVGNVCQTVVFEGLRMLAPPASDEVAFARRASLLRAAGVGLAALPIAVGLIYLARGSWFASAETALVVGAAALAGALSYLAIWNATLPRRGAWAFLGASALAIVAGVVFAFSAEPDVARARSRLAGGDVERAAEELAAMDDGGDPDVAGARRELALRRVLASSDAEAAAMLLADVAPDTPEGATALAHVDDLRVAAAEAALARGEIDLARRWLEACSERRRATDGVRELAERIQRAHDARAFEQARAELARGDIARARERLAGASEAARGTAQGRELAVRVAVASGEQAIEQHAWRRALDAADEAEGLGHETQASALRDEIRAAMERHQDELLAAARQAKAPEAQIEAIDAAERGVATIAEVRGTPLPAELVPLKKTREKAVAALARRRAAEEKARIAAERKAEAARVAAERRAEVERVRAERREASEARRLEIYDSGPTCTHGCRCGNACISCSKRCRK